MQKCAHVMMIYSMSSKVFAYILKGIRPVLIAYACVYVSQEFRSHSILCDCCSCVRNMHEIEYGTLKTWSFIAVLHICEQIHAPIRSSRTHLNEYLVWILRSENSQPNVISTSMRQIYSLRKSNFMRYSASRDSIQCCRMERLKFVCVCRTTWWPIRQMNAHTQTHNTFLRMITQARWERERYNAVYGDFTHKCWNIPLVEETLPKEKR